ncbi:hypothetical protein V6N11_057185 [Hibiscus sabdariffa]|uniref:DNA/RNA-binding protein Kin17 WH-like domain-containing protein n=1 Tax=Hibiscus sabdariffa TaxID=183260 RepID=A0ABR2NK75_9ROSI
MGKNDFLTPKAIANRIKAKGLQKLRWYCQMCQKQCRDENGFKCHCMSESHQRQMQIFGQNPDRIVSGYSEEFESNFLDLMKRSHRFSRIAATVVYNEFINDRHHVHMNSTQWATLTEFVKHLGRTGKCKVDETPKGWFITYIDRDSETLFKERLKNKRIKLDMVEEEKHEREIQKQIEKAEQLKTPSEAEENEEKAVIKEINLESGMKVGFSLGGGTAAKAEKGESSSTARLVFEEEENEKSKAKIERKESSVRKSALEELMREEEKAKERRLSTAHIVDQLSRLLGVDTDKFCAKVQIEKGVYDGRVLKAIEYEDICKVAQATVADLQEAIHKRTKKFYPSRQRLTLPVPSGSRERPVDLGPQVSYRTLFFFEYLGPLILYPVFYYFPVYKFFGYEEKRVIHPVQTYALYYWCFHYFKRIMETFFVHRFSHATSPLSNVFRNCAYYWTFGSYIAYYVNHPLYTPVGDLQMKIGFGFGVVCQLANFYCHIILKNLRSPDGSGGYQIPRGFLFNIVTCANYTTEIYQWLGFNIATQTVAGYVFLVVATSIMTNWALAKHRRLKKLFDGKDGRPKYPRRDLFIFLLRHEKHVLMLMDTVFDKKSGVEYAIRKRAETIEMHMFMEHTCAYHGFRNQQSREQQDESPSSKSYGTISSETKIEQIQLEEMSN